MFTPHITGFTTLQMGGLFYVAHIFDNLHMEQKGVKRGLRLLKIDGEPFTPKLLNQKRNGNVPYVIKFTDERAEDQVNNCSESGVLPVPR